MRRRILNLAVLFAIFTLTLSYVAILPATSQTTGTIITKLETLQGEVENENPPALANKVNAVIHQIEAGAFDGALNKLENDVKKSITAWVDDPIKQKELLDLVDDIIKDINDVLKGKNPDFEISADPELEVARGSSNTTIITITSRNNFTQKVVLTNSTTASGITLSLNPLSVVPPPNGTVTSTLTVTAAIGATSGEITVTATSTGFEPKSVEIELRVISPPTPEGDETPPTIASVLRSPEIPAYNESVTVSAFVYDVGSGVKQVTLNYSSGTVWTPIDMILSDGFYNASIPSFSFNTTVQYRVFAFDNADNLAASNMLSYTVVDPFPPFLRIDSPAQGSYLSGTVAITAFMKDQNSGGESGFGSAELSINGTVVPLTLSSPDTYTYAWNTATFGADGTYIVKLTVRDKAGKETKESLTVTVDNTLPTAAINSPASGSYLHLSVLIKLTGSDANFDKMEVRIDDELVKTSLTSGSEVSEWNTRNSGEGVHSVTLKVYDKAGNTKSVLVNVTVDNTAPLIGTPSWSPKEPAALVDIQVNVTVFEASFGSGVENVTLWFMNTTVGDWQPAPMELENGNWTTTLSNQSDTKVKFFIQAFDQAGNMAETADQFEFAVAGPSGSPLIWILAAIAVIGAGSGGATYYMRRRRKKTSSSGSSVPSASLKPAPPPKPASLPAKKQLRRNQREFQQLMNTLVNAKNAPRVDYSRYINA